MDRSQDESASVGGKPYGYVVEGRLRDGSDSWDACADAFSTSRAAARRELALWAESTRNRAFEYRVTELLTRKAEPAETDWRWRMGQAGDIAAKIYSGAEDDRVIGLSGLILEYADPGVEFDDEPSVSTPEPPEAEPPREKKPCTPCQQHAGCYTACECPCHTMGAPRPEREETPRKQTGSEMIAAERERQLGKWSPEHDDGHDDGELIGVAARLIAGDRDEWGLAEKHKHDYVRRLVIAGALIAAEVDRWQRDMPEPTRNRGDRG